MEKYEGLNEAMVKRYAPRPGRRPLLPAMSDKAQVALMCRMLFRVGWNEHIAGHITYRQAGEDERRFVNRTTIGSTEVLGRVAG